MEKIGIKWPTIHDDILFWYYPEIGKWSYRTDNEIAYKKAQARVNEIERWAKDRYHEDNLSEQKKTGNPPNGSWEFENLE